MTRDDPPQNIYDDPAFFDGYQQLTRFNAEFGTAMEHGPFVEMLGAVRAKRVLDLGCGAGQLAYKVAQDGAAQVTAIDASERMLAVARSRWHHPRVTYARVALEDAAYEDGAFDLVVSSLAFHYVADFEGLARRIARWLAPSGLLVFSTEHPIYSARSTDHGWIDDAAGKSRGWGIDDYAVEGLRERRWFVEGVRRYHRMLSTILNTLIATGFVVERVEESHPSEAWLREHPEHAEERRRPMFLLVKASRRRD